MCRWWPRPSGERAGTRRNDGNFTHERRPCGRRCGPGEKTCFSDPWSKKRGFGIGKPLSLWLVATEGDRLAGYVGSQTVLGEADMMNLAVDPDFRRQGIGEALVLRLVAELKSRGAYCLTLEVRASNEAAIGLYDKLGFAAVGRRRGYYEKPREDACILRKEWNL